MGVGLFVPEHRHSPNFPSNSGGHLVRLNPLLRRPEKDQEVPAPAFHAASRAVRRELWDAYSMFVAAYRAAAEKLRPAASPRPCHSWAGRPARRPSWPDGNLGSALLPRADGGGVSGWAPTRIPEVCVG